MRVTVGRTRPPTASIQPNEAGDYANLRQVASLYRDQMVDNLDEALKS